MLRFSITNLVKFLIGILIVQGATVLLVVTAQKTSLEQTALFFVALGGTIGVLTALWFNSVADAAGRQALARAKEDFSREREKIRVRAEQEKVKEVRNTQRQVEKEKRRAGTGGNLKTGLMIGGAMSAGVMLMLTSFVSLGLVALSAASGAALGYGVRVRQERLGFGRGLAGGLLGGERKEVAVIESQPPREALPPAQQSKPKALRGA
jgi:hypothetical protein